MNIYLNTTPITDTPATTAINIVVEQQIALFKKLGANVQVHCAHIWGTNCRLTLSPLNPATDLPVLRSQQRQGNLNLMPERATDQWIYTFSLNTDDLSKREVLRVIEAVRLARHAPPPPPPIINWDAIPMSKFGCGALVVVVVLTILFGI